MKGPELNYDIKLAYKAEWWRYFGEYKNSVDFIFKSLRGGEVTSLSLPLAFLIRHTLELGYKMNLLELQKVSEKEANVTYQKSSAHKIEELHLEFESQMKAIFEKFNADNEIVNQFNELNAKLEKLKGLFHQLDELSFAFRYPVKNDGVTPNFNNQSAGVKTDIINFKLIKELYDDSMSLMSYSTDVVKDIITSSNNN